MLVGPAGGGVRRYGPVDVVASVRRWLDGRKDPFPGAVPLRTGTDPECVAPSLPTPDPLRLAQAARVLRSAALAGPLVTATERTPAPERMATAVSLASTTGRPAAPRWSMQGVP